MRRLLFLLLSLLAAPLAAQEADLVLHDVVLLDLETGETGPPVDILIADDRIAAVTPVTEDPPRAREVVEGEGRVVMPGLWDSHVHVFSRPDEYETALPAYLLAGVTTIRDMGGLLPLEEQRRIAEAAATGEMGGPRILLSGAWVDAPPESWPGMYLAGSPTEARAVVAEIAASGWPAVKAYSMLSEPTYLALADAAAEAELMLVGHVPESVTLATAREAGHRVVEHSGRVTKACSPREAEMVAGAAEALTDPDPRAALIAEMATHTATMVATWDEALCREVVARMAEADMAVVPTMVVADFYLERRPVDLDARLARIPAPVREDWQAGGDFRLEAMTDDLRAIAEEALDQDRETLLLAARAGVPILAGTDASYANPFLFHGASLIDELDRFVSAGLSPLQALRSATATPARIFDGHEGPLILPGARADLLMLDSNPASGLSTLRRPHAVVAGGILHDQDALDRIARDLERAAEAE